jgi:hypothetical protein
MSEDNKTYSSIMDFAGKAAAAVGVLLGAAYVIGFFKNFTLYINLKSIWILDLIDLQGMIKDGLPFVMQYLFIAVVFFFFLRTIRKHPYLLRILCVVFVLSLVLGWFVANFNSHFELKTVTKGLAYGIACTGALGAGMLSWSLHSFIEGGRSKLIFINVLIGMNFVLCLVPSVAGYLTAEDLKFGREQVSVLINKNEDVVGLLVGIVGGKYLIMDCSMAYQFWLEDVSSEFKVRQSIGGCNPKWSGLWVL